MSGFFLRMVRFRTGDVKCAQHARYGLPFLGMDVIPYRGDRYRVRIDRSISRLMSRSAMTSRLS